MIYSASKVISTLSAKITVPSIVKVNNFSGLVFTIKTTPAGTEIESPSLGGISPPQVSSLSQSKPYWNK